MEDSKRGKPGRKDPSSQQKSPPVSDGSDAPDKRGLLPSFHRSGSQVLGESTRDPPVCGCWEHPLCMGRAPAAQEPTSPHPLPPGHPCVSKRYLVANGKLTSALAPFSLERSSREPGPEAGQYLGWAGEHGSFPPRCPRGWCTNSSSWEAPRASAQGLSSPRTRLVSQNGQNRRPYGTWAPPWLPSRGRAGVIW